MTKFMSSNLWSICNIKRNIGKNFHLTLDSLSRCQAVRFYRLQQQRKIFIIKAGQIDKNNWYMYLPELWRHRRGRLWYCCSPSWALTWRRYDASLYWRDAKLLSWCWELRNWPRTHHLSFYSQLTTRPSGLVSLSKCQDEPCLMATLSEVGTVEWW